MPKSLGNGTCCKNTDHHIKFVLVGIIFVFQLKIIYQKGEKK